MPKPPIEHVINFWADDPSTLENTFAVSATLSEAMNELATPFKQPYFDVFQTTSGRWDARKKRWITGIGIRGEEGRAAANTVESDNADITSVFDPVLCEISYGWFCPKGGNILDPFAGGSTRGLVAAFLGYEYTGIEIRQEQVDANCKQHKAIKALYDRFYASEIAAGNRKPMKTPNWIVGDSAELEKLIPIGEQYDLLFSCPPYYNLEVYSATDGDGSTAQTYEEFLVWYEHIYRQAVARLRNDRFAVITVGDVRNERGSYHLFPEDTTILFARKLGLVPHNKAILCTPIWSAAARAEATFPSNRRLGHIYQEVKIFWKGADKKNAVKEALGELGR